MKYLSLIFLLFSSFLGFSQSLPGTIAVVTYGGKTELVTQKSFEEKVAALEKASSQTLSRSDRQELLDVMINEILMMEAAQNSNITVTESQILQMAKAQMQVNIPDAQFKQMVAQQTGVSWEEYADQAKKSVMLQQYLTSTGNIDQTKARATDAQVSEYYQLNRSQFMNPDLVRFSHIFFDTKTEGQTEESARSRAQSIRSQIANGSLTFPEAARSHSDDKQSAGRSGEMGFIPRNEQRILSLFGNNFVSRVFGLEKDQVSDVLQSNVGFHIVQVTEKLDQKFLTLDDKIFPGQETSVREFIRAQLSQVLGQAVIQQALEKTANELREEATILNFFNRVYPEN